MTEPSSSEALFEQIQQKLSSAQAGISDQKTGKRELETLYKITDLVSSISHPDTLLRQIVDLAIELTKAQRGMIILVEGPNKELSVRVARNLQGRDETTFTDISKGIVREVIDQQKPFLSVDAQNDARLIRNQSIFEHKICSLMCVPIISANEVIGVIYVDSQSLSGIFTLQQKEFLEAVARLAGVVIRKANLERQLKAEITVKSDQVNLLRKEITAKFHHKNIIGKSAALAKVFATIEAVANSSANVLILGESGTGKELIAKSVHYQSNRSDKPFVAINCAALPESLLEAELFGYEKGAFTNAYYSRKGKFEVADGGTLFFDEIGDMSPVTQAKVLRAIQEREFTRIGGDKTIKVDIRLVAATNRDLLAEVKEGNFREDLYYRLNVITIRVPALRERREDIPLLIDHFLRKYAKDNGRQVPSLTMEAKEALLNYHWEGNIRELESAINQGVVLCENNTITLKDLPENICRGGGGATSVLVPDLSVGFNAIKEEATSKLEQELVLRYLESTRGNVAAAAREAQMSRVNFHRLMKKYDIHRDDLEG